jgi:endonuclease-3
VTERGTYTLLVELESPAEIAFGARGDRDLPAGRYAYTGSAFGSGGFSRVERHERVARGDHDVRHWHVDYLLGHPASRLADDVRTTAADVECDVARRLGDDAVADAIPEVAGVGASDCDCRSHLHGPAERDALERAVRAAHARSRTDADASGRFD